VSSIIIQHQKYYMSAIDNCCMCSYHIVKQSLEFFKFFTKIKMRFAHLKMLLYLFYTRVLINDRAVLKKLKEYLGMDHY